MHLNAQLYEHEHSISSFMGKSAQKIMDKILKPLRKLQKKQDLTLDDIAKGAVKVKKNIDSVYNINMNCGQVFDETIRTLQNDYGIHLSEKKLKHFKKLIKHFEKESNSGWFWNCSLQDMSVSKGHEPQEDEYFSTSLAMTILEAFCGIGLAILGGYCNTYPGGAAIGRPLIAVGGGG